MNQIEWSQAANHTYQGLGNADQEYIDRILSSLAAEELIREANRVNNDLFVYRVPPHLRLLLKREGPQLKLLNIFDKRDVDALFHRSIT